MDYLIVVELFIGVLFAFIAFYFFSRAHGDHRTYDRRGDDSYDEREGYSYEGGVGSSYEGYEDEGQEYEDEEGDEGYKTKAQTATIVGSALLLLS
jgi:hypothetical protein